MRRFGARVCGLGWALRLKLLGDLMQPATRVTRYRPM
jgi:hypothetical protein